ncbi:LysR family transcriptional regulator [bacterium]|nr:MAG: LysR family transcriptional regulator [bacterium]
MELRHLRYFMAVAEERHFGRAAEQLNMAQPPLSQQIRKLESELGVELFHRDRRPIDLTEAGRAFLEEARLTLAQAGHAMETARRAKRGLIGRITVGTVASATYNVLQNVLRTYRERFPDVRLTVRELSSPEQLLALEQRQIHIGFLRPPVTDEHLHVATVAREPFVIALPADHPLAKKKRISLRTLEQESLVLFPRSEAPGFRDQIVNICRSAGFEPRLVQEANQTDTMISLVAAGLGVTLMPASIQRLNLAGVVYRPVAEQTPPAELYAAWRADETSIATLALVEVIRIFASLTKDHAAT